MGFIIKVLIFCCLCRLVIIIFERVTGIKITDDTENERNKKEKKVLSPLEQELEKIKPHAPQHAEEIAKYIIPLYKKDYVRIGNSFFTSIDTIVSKYLGNQLLFSEKYEGRIIALAGSVGTIGKNGERVFITIGDNHYCGMVSTGRPGGECVSQLIECYIDETDMEDKNYRDLVLNMKSGANVTVIGVLGKERYGEFSLYGTTIIEVNNVIPSKIMNIATNSICEKYNTENKHDSE